jgi:hypothetical protein
MKFAILAAALFVSAPLIAQTAPVPAATSMVTIDSPIEAIAADAKGKAVLDATFPGMTAHPMYDQFKAMTLKQIAPMSQGAITDEAIAKAAAALAAK